MHAFSDVSQSNSGQNRLQDYPTKCMWNASNLEISSIKSRSNFIDLDQDSSYKIVISPNVQFMQCQMNVPYYKIYIYSVHTCYILKGSHIPSTENDLR